jgi:hypothetical protein
VGAAKEITIRNDAHVYWSLRKVTDGASGMKNETQVL